MNSLKRLLFLFLAFGVIFITTQGLSHWLNPAKEERSVQTPATKRKPSSTASASTQKPKSAIAQDKAPSTKHKLQRAVIETDSFRAIFTNQGGGALLAYRVKGERFQRQDPRGKNLISTDKPNYLSMRMHLPELKRSADVPWELHSFDAKHGKGLSFRATTNALEVVRKIEPGRNAYQLWSTLQVRNRSDQQQKVQPTISTYHYVRREDESGGFFLASQSQAISHGICAYGDDLEREDREDLLEAQRYTRDVKFTGIENSYFTQVFAPSMGAVKHCEILSSDRGGTVDDPDGSLFEAHLRYKPLVLAAGEQKVVRTLAFLGPKDTRALRAAGHALPKVVDLGFFSIITRYLVELLRLIEGYVGNWGLAIILLTVLVKLLLYPLTEKSFQSMAKMRLLKPDMDRINELYKDDREKKGAAMMELYRKHKINPVGGCLPSLLQLPIWFSLYTSLSTNVELYQAPFIGWWQDLSSPDPYFMLPLLLGVLMFMQQRLTPTTMDPVQAKIMMYVMPVMITSFMLFLPAGLCLYMVTNSALGMAQQKFIHYRLDKGAPSEAHSEAEAEAAGKQSHSASQPKLVQRRHRRGRA